MSATEPARAATADSAGAAAPARPDPLHGVLVPALFVLLWSSGFAACKAGVAHASGLSYLLIRFAAAAAILVVVSIALRASWPKTKAQWLHLGVAGALIHAAYLGPNFWAASHGFPVGITALIGALQPLLTAVLAAAFLAEHVTRKQWIGLTLGLVGIVMVLDDRIAFDWSRPVELMWVAVGLVSVTVGTLYQKRFCGFQDLRSGPAIQLAAASVFIAIAHPFVEPFRVDWTPQFIVALAWLVFLSATLYGIMAALFKRGAATRVASLFYLAPPITSLALWFFFDEKLGALAMAGMAVTVAGVALAARR